MSRKRGRTSNRRRLVDKIIQLKVDCNFSKDQLIQIIRFKETPEEAEKLEKLVDKELRRCYCAYRLHGCSQCNAFIWFAEDNHPCTNCHNQDGRYDKHGNPVQDVFYFPLLPRLHEMYKDEEWRHALTYPDTRPVGRGPRARVADVFDGLVYKRLRASAGDCSHFVSFAHCADAVSANKRMSRSILPVNLSVLNYDPRVRNKKANFLLTFLLPPKMKTACAHKFYDILSEELNHLYYTGIDAGRLKGALIMLRNDQKGKEFDLGLRSCTSYDGPCSVCEIIGHSGSGPFTKVSVRDYRRYLPHDHPYRRDPRSAHPELRPPPEFRTRGRNVEAIEIINVPGALPFYYGYISLYMFSGLQYMEPYRQSAADLSHNISNFLKVHPCSLFPRLCFICVRVHPCLLFACS